MYQILRWLFVKSSVGDHISEEIFFRYIELHILSTYKSHLFDTITYMFVCPWITNSEWWSYSCRVFLVDYSSILLSNYRGVITIQPRTSLYLIL